MPWNTLTTTDITAEILPDEVTAMNTVQGSATILNSILARVVAEIQARILSGGNQIGQPGTVPDQLRGAAIAMVRWEWFCNLPKTDLQSDFRKAQNEAAQKRMEKVQAREEKVEIPTNPQNVAGPSGRVEVVRPGHKMQNWGEIGQT